MYICGEPQSCLKLGIQQDRPRSLPAPDLVRHLLSILQFQKPSPGIVCYHHKQSYVVLWPQVSLCLLFRSCRQMSAVAGPYTESSSSSLNHCEFIASLGRSRENVSGQVKQENARDSQETFSHTKSENRKSPLKTTKAVSHNIFIGQNRLRGNNIISAS